MRYRGAVVLIHGMDNTSANLSQVNEAVRETFPSDHMLGACLCVFLLSSKIPVLVFVVFVIYLVLAFLF